MRTFREDIYNWKKSKSTFYPAKQQLSIQTFIYKYACNNGQYVLGVKLYNRLSYTVIVFEEINNDEKNEMEMHMYSNDTQLRVLCMKSFLFWMNIITLQW